MQTFKNYSERNRGPALGRTAGTGAKPKNNAARQRMNTTFYLCNWRCFIGGVFSLAVAFSSAFAQVRPVTGISAFYEEVVDTNGNYSIAGGGTGSFPTGITYKLTFNSSNQNNLIIRGFETGTNGYNYIQLAQQINIVRVDNATVTGRHNIVFFEEDSVATTNVNVKPSLVTTMVNSLRSDLVNRGADNVFCNTGNGDGNNNNIERIDYVFNAGFPYYNFTGQRGFLVMDRGGNDRFKIAVIRAVNSNGIPTSFSRPVSVLETDWGPSGITLATTVMRGYTENGAKLRPSARTTAQSLSGVYLSWDQFGLTTNDMVYGYSLAANDVTTNGAYWTQVTNAAYFPTDTTDGSTYGGLDLISGGAMFFDEVLEVGIGDRVWEDWDGDGIQDTSEPGLSNILVHIYTSSNVLAATARTDSNGFYFAQGMGPGTYYLQFFSPDGYTFSPRGGSHDPELDSDPDYTGLAAAYVMGSGQTNLSVDAGLYLTPGNLRLSKTVAPSSGNIGDPVVYTLAITNVGTPNTALIQVTDALPSAFVFSGYGATTGTFSPTTGVWDVGALAPGTVATLAITGTVNIGSGGSWVTNNASITRMNRPDTNLNDNTASAIFHVQSADLSVSKVENKTTMDEGDAILFTLTVTNRGPDTASGIQINDLLPTELVFSNATPSQGTYSNATGYWTVGTLTNGAVATLQISATAAVGSGGHYLTNTAAVGASSHEDPDSGNNGQSVVVVVYGADLSIDKSVEPLAAVELQTVTYTLVVTNPGPSETTGILVLEPLTNGLSYVSHEASTGTYSGVSGIWTLGTLGVNSSATLQIHATVGGGTMNTIITNQSRITASDQPDPNASNNVDTAALSVSSLVLTKASDVTITVHPGGTITYTIVASNAGSLAHANVSLSDLVPDGTTYVPGSLTVTRSPANPTSLLYTSSSTFVVPANVTNVTVEAWGGGGGGGRARGNPATGGGGAGGSYAKKVLAVVPLQSYTVTVGAGGIGGNGTGTDTQHGRPGEPSWFNATNTVFAQGGARGMSEGGTNSINGSPGLGSPALCVGDTVYRGGNGSTGVYTSGTGYSGAGGGGAGTTGNGGNASAGTGGSGTTLYGGNGANGVGNSTPGANGSVNGGGGSGGKANSSTDQNGGSGANGLVRITCEAEGDTHVPPDLASNWTLAPGQKLQATFSVQVDDPLDVMAITNTATADSDQQVVPVSATVVDPVIHTDLAIAKTASVASVQVGNPVVFTLKVTNQSTQEAATGVVVGDLLPGGFTFVSAAPSQGTYNPTTGVWTVGTIHAAADAALAMNVTALAGGGGLQWTNTATITDYDQVDPDLSNNATSVVVLIEGADLGLTKTVDYPTPNEGNTVVYTIRLTNSGPSTVTNVAVSDLLTNGLTYVTHSVSHGSYATNTGLWSVGTVTSGYTATLTLTATINTNTFGTYITNRCNISAASLPDPVSTNNQAEVSIFVSGLKMTKISDVVGHASPGDTVTYTIVVSNVSTVTRTGVRISDILPTGTAFVASSLTMTQTLASFTTAVYTSSSTFATPPSVTSVTVEAWGGGGGGGGALGNPCTGGGGAGGSYARKVVTVVPTSNYTVTVGIGGSGGTTAASNGLPGSNSWFITTNTVFAQGGARGLGTAANSNNAAAGAGSSALCVGDTVYSGGNGSTGNWTSGTAYYSGAGGGGTGNTGNGGNASIGTGGTGTATNGGNGANGVTNNLAGANGSTYGGGGSGGKANSTADRAGGAGAAGLVQITYPMYGYTNVPPNLASNWTLAAGATLTATFQALVINPGSVTQLLNTAAVSCDQESLPVTASVADLVLHTDLEISQTVDNNHPNEGDTVTYTIVVTNVWPNNATNILVSVPLTNSLTYVSHLAGTGTYSSATGIWSLGALAVGASAQVQISATVQPNTAGTSITNRAWISGADMADINVTNNEASAVITVVGVDIGLGKAASTTTPVENGLLVYTVLATNFGPDTATDVQVTDVLPTNFTYQSYVAGQGTYNSTSGVWTVGTLDPLQTTTLAITALVKTNTSGKSITNTASLTHADQVDYKSTNNSAKVVVIPGQALLSLNKSADTAGPVWAGDVITYTLAVTNRSGLAQTNVTVTDPLPTGTVYVADSCQVTAPATVDETFADQFSRRVYSNNDGMKTWASDWIESESNGPTAGAIQIQFDNGVDETYTLRFSSATQSIRRAANLSIYTSATLEFDYQRIGLDSSNEYVAIQVSSNGVSGWTELARFKGPATDTEYTHYNMNLAASFITTSTTVRLISPAGMDGTDIVWFDNVLITGSQRVNLTVPGGAPPNLVSGNTLEPNEAMSVQFQVWVDNPSLYTQIVNQASLTSVQMPSPQVSTVVIPVDTCFTAAPDGVYADPTNATAFTAHWMEVPGAFGYRLDVSTNLSFASGYVAGYSNRAVAGTLAAVTGLTHDVTYYFRVRAEWNGQCTSANSETQTVTTLSLPIIGVFPEELDFGVVDVDAVSNLTLSVTNSGSGALDISSILFYGAGSGDFSVRPTNSTIPSSNSLALTVTFAPTAARPNAVTLTIYNTSPDFPELAVPIVGEGFNPDAQPPELLAYRVTDASALTNEVTDCSLATGAAAVSFTLHHITGMTTNGASFSFVSPDGTVAFTNGTFSSVQSVTLEGRTCQVFSATTPRFFPADLGVYTARVTVASSNGIWLTNEARFTSIYAGETAPELIDDFGRADVANNIGEGWVPVITGPVGNNVQIRNQGLQLYGSGGTGGTNGRISIVRDLSSRYDPVLTNNLGTMTWAFNFYSGRTNHLGYAPGVYGAVFVLGADATNLVSGTGNGYAVRICSNQVALASFVDGLDMDSDLTLLGSAANLSSATSAVAVEVDLELETGIWSLYVHELSGSGIGAFGNPLEGMEGHLVTQVTNTLHLYRSLPYVGCYWNHGNAAAGTNAAAFFDDIYAPYVMPDSEPMISSAVDNDIMLPTSLGTILVNGQPVPEEVPDRFGVVWTNAPEFIVTFDPLASDQDPGYSIPPIQRDIRGIGEYRVTPDPVNVLSSSNRGLVGLPFPVVTTNGALANYGFELITAGGDWVMDSNCFYQSLAADSALVFEGSNSLRQAAGGVAYQTFEFRNAGVTPRIQISGWHRGGPGKITIGTFSTNDLTNAVAVAEVYLTNMTEWTAFSLAEQDLGNSTVEILKVALSAEGGENYWDDLRFSVNIGTNRPSMRFHASAENQGLVPQYLFAVDEDPNRVGDRLAGMTKYFYIPFDITPPTPVHMPIGGSGASTETVDDPTAQFDLQWSTNGLGPDDPDSPVHPTHNPADIDILSRFHSYKIFYGTFDTQQVPLNDDPTSTNSYIYTHFIANGAYRSWNAVSPETQIVDPSAPSYQSNYFALTNMNTTHIRLYDLDYDQDYVVVVVAVDQAGNVGNAGVQSWATNNTIRFALISGKLMNKTAAQAAFPQARFTHTNVPTAAALYWIASGPTNSQGIYTNIMKDYELISWDSSRFQESTNNQWKLVDTVRSNWFVDDSGQMLSRSTVHFYRASNRDRWRLTNSLGQPQRQLASEEVYAMHNVTLSSGPNFVALHGIPYTNTFRAIFGGTETFPGGPGAMPASGATVVQFFTPGTTAISDEQYYLSTSNQWFQVGGGDVTDVIQPANFFTRGFSITLPNPLPAAYSNATASDANLGTNLSAMVWTPILQVPTNGFEQVIHTGARTGRTTVAVFNLVALTLPVCAHPSEMHLLESGFVNGTKGASDEIYTIDTSTKTMRQGSTIYCDPTGVWRFMASDNLVGGGFFAPNDVLVIVSKNGGIGNSWIWRYHPNTFYNLPNRSMSPAP